MMESFHRFFWEDSKTRWRVYSLSVLGSVCYASLRSIVFHKPERGVTIELVVILVVSNILAALLYWLWEGRRHESTSFSRVRLSPLLKFAGVAAGLLLLFAPRLSVSTVQAAVINQRLRSAASSVEPTATASLSNDQLKSRFQKIASIANTSIAYGIRARPDLLDQVEQNLTRTLKSPEKPLEDTRQSGVAAFVALVAYARYNNVLIAANVPTILVPQGIYLLESPVHLDKGAAWWQGSPQGSEVIAAPPNFSAVFPVSHSDVVFNQVDFDSIGSRRPFIETDNKSKVVVMNASVTGTSQKLDSIVWMNVKFVNSEIIYHGGPVYLGDVTFEACRFEFGNESESQRVLLQIKEAGSQKVTLTSGL